MRVRHSRLLRPGRWLSPVRGRAPAGAIVCAAAAAMLAGCGAQPVPAARDAATSPAEVASSPAEVASPVWLNSLQMVSARDGWALAWTADPAAPAPARLMAVRTVDGGHTWATVTPAQASPLLAGTSSSLVLFAVSASRAWLAATGTRPAVTEVFGTTNGGRSWTRSAPISAPGTARWLDFTGPTHGWLLADLGAAMGRDAVALHRTADGGRHWPLAAASPPAGQAGTSPDGLPAACDKTGIAFATPATGWLTGACNSLSGMVLATHDGGAHWAPQPLPLPAGICRQAGCLALPPQFSGSTGFLLIAVSGRAPYLLATTDTGASWHLVAGPHAAGPLGSFRLFSARQMLLMPAASQGVPGRVFYLTSDGGRTWVPVRQGAVFPAGTTMDFTSPENGFAWNASGSGPPLLYATTDGGRTWASYSPRLAGGRA